MDSDEVRLSDTKGIKAKRERVSKGSFLKENTSLEIITYYEKFLERAIDVRDRVKGDQSISPSPILSDFHYIINKDMIDDLYEYAMTAPDDYEEMLIHTLDVTFASLRVGKGLDYEIKELLKLGLSAFLENVGMYKVPDSILQKEGKLTEQEIAIIRNHPYISSQILNRSGEKYRWLASVALQVHERWDGSGYPKGLKGDGIPEVASIIGLIDTYMAMIKERSYRDKYLQTDAVKFIIKDAKRLFPPRVLKAFLDQISLFPVNTYVKLNNKSIGRVISTDKTQPMRPIIEILYDVHGIRREKREVVKLSENPLLYISGSIRENELP